MTTNDNKPASLVIARFIASSIGGISHTLLWIFIVLKVSGLVAWPWLFVFSPLLISLGVAALGLLIWIAAALMLAALNDK